MKNILLSFFLVKRNLGSVENKIIQFLEDMTFFLIIAFLFGTVISYPIYYTGVEYTHLYKRIVSLGFVLIILSFFIVRFLRNLFDEYTILSYGGNISKSFLYQLSFIYSVHRFLPNWMNWLSRFFYFEIKEIVRGAILLLIIFFYLLTSLPIIFLEIFCGAFIGLFLGFGFIKIFQNDWSTLSKGGFTLGSSLLFVPKLIVKIVFKFLDLIFLIYVWVFIGFTSLEKISGIIYSICLLKIKPMSILPELPAIIYFLICLFEVISIILIFKGKSLVESENKSKYSVKFMLGICFQFVLLYVLFFSMLLYKLILLF